MEGYDPMTGCSTALHVSWKPYLCPDQKNPPWQMCGMLFWFRLFKQSLHNQQFVESCKSIHRTFKHL